MTTAIALILIASGAVLLIRGHLTRAASVAVIGLALVTQMGCGGAAAKQREVAAAVLDVTGAAVDAYVPHLKNDAIAEGRAAVQKAESPAEADFLLNKVEAKWQSIFSSLSLFKRLHDAAADQLERGGDFGLRHLVELAGAYCDLRSALGDKAKSWPDVPLVGCPKEVVLP